MIQILKELFGRGKLEDNVSLTEKSAEQIKQIKENRKLSLEEIREKTKRFSKQSCGCYRHQARNLFSQEINDNPEKTLALYKIVSPYLHSYCNSTRSSYSKNNDDVLIPVYFASLKIISDRKKSNLEDVINSNSRIIGDLNENLRKYPNIILNKLGTDCTTNLIKEAINFADNDRSYEALLILKNAEELAKIVGDKSANEFIGDLKKSYLKKAVKEIKELKDFNEKIRKLYVIGNSVFSYDKTGVRFIKTAEDLSNLASKSKKSEERLTDRVSHYSSYRKINPLEIRYNNLSSDLNREVEKVRKEEEIQRKSLLDKIKYLGNFKSNKEISTKKAEYESQLGHLEKETEIKTDELNREYRTKRNQIESDIDESKKERNTYIEKIKSRKLTKPEYKSLLTKMRFKERK